MWRRTITESFFIHRECFLTFAYFYSYREISKYNTYSGNEAIFEDISFSEINHNKKNLNGSIYIPLGIDFRLGDKNKLLKHVHLIVEINPSIYFLKVSFLFQFYLIFIINKIEKNIVLKIAYKRKTRCINTRTICCNCECYITIHICIAVNTTIIVC